MRFLKTMVVSTAHITEEDDVQLYAIEEHGHNDGDLIVDQIDCGWHIIVPEEINDEDDDQGMSESFWHLVKTAKFLECDRLVFDRDEKPVPQFRKFEW
jgi:hypothetical protein